MKKVATKHEHLYVADFETTVDEDAINQEETEVWSAAICPVLKDPQPSDVTVYNNIYDFVTHIEMMHDESIIFFHNAKFDLSFLLCELNRQGFIPLTEEIVEVVDGVEQKRIKYLSDQKQDATCYTYKISVSVQGQWYSCRIKFANSTVEIRDSLKKLPFDLRTIAKSFNTNVQKLDMDYVGSHKAFGVITPEEMDYIVNDVLILSQAMYIIWYDYEMQGLTIGADCLKEFKSLFDKKSYNNMFPALQDYYFGVPEGGAISAYDYCLKAYSGGWCWKNPVSHDKVYYADITYTEEVQKKLDRLHRDRVLVKHMCVIDVNSLYPSVMINSDKTEGYPVGLPAYFYGEPAKADEVDACVFRRFRCRFRLRPGYLPFIHIRGEAGYDANECLTSSVNAIGDDPIREYTMTQVEFDLFIKHYELFDYQPIDYIKFRKAYGIFDQYIEKYKQMKIDATKTGNKAMRQIAKLFLNNLYGKLATSTNSSYKTIYFDDDTMKFDSQIEFEKTPVYIACGAYVTAYARRFTITAGQANYYEGQDHGVMYADTDSLHIIDMTPDEVQGVDYDDAEFLKWAVEVSSCAVATYAKQKTYIEVATETEFNTVTDDDGNPDIKIIIKAAGMGKNAKDYFKKCLNLEEDEKNDKNEIVTPSLTVDVFRKGLCLKNKNLKARQAKGGIILTPCDFKIS